MGGGGGPEAGKMVILIFKEKGVGMH